MFKRILVCGGGAIGGTIAAHLTRARHPVTVVDLVPEHVAAIRARGLRITGPVVQFTATCPAVLPADLNGTFDLVLLAVKAQHTETAVEMVRPHLSPDGAIVSLQNGLNELAIARLVGRDRTIGCFINFGADYIEPGRIEYGGRGPLVVGELDGQITERLKAVLTLLKDFEPRAEATDNIFGYLWSKLAFGMLLVSQTLSDRPTEEFLDDPQWRPMTCRTVGDVAAVAQAEGVKLMMFQGFDAAKFLGNDAAQMNKAIADYAETRRGSTKLYSGIWRDLAVRKRTTEISYQYRPILEAAHRHGLEVPALATAVAMIEAIEADRRELSGGALGRELAALVEARTGASDKT